MTIVDAGDQRETPEPLTSLKPPEPLERIELSTFLKPLSAPGTSLEILDTTLRDGAQGGGISFSVQDKLALTSALDALGVAWIEAGNPGSNPKDLEFFRCARHERLTTARLAAFGATRKKGVAPGNDPLLKSLLDAETEAVVIFGKGSRFHATAVLQVEPEENRAMIAETISFLKAEGRIVIYDAEHFFDGWQEDPAYALATLTAAATAGADRIVLCDTNGGSFPATISAGVQAARDLHVPVGIHAHNDAGLAIAGSLAAVEAGALHIQGTLLGFGERCGNTALAALIPSLELKLGYQCLPPGRLDRLSALCRRIAEIANVALPVSMPYVGDYAFAHKAGMHADGILKTRSSFEHIDPLLVGNTRQFLMSEVGGRSAIAERARKIDPSLTRDHPVVLALADKLKNLEAAGWQFDGADGSFELLVRRELGRYQPLFTIQAYRVVSEHPSGGAIACAHAWVKVLVDGKEEIAAAEGEGPVNALDGALRRALIRFYPELEQVRLLDYKVRIISGDHATGAATAAQVRVLIESSDHTQTWTTLGVSADIIDASRAALVDSIEYKLIGDIERRFKAYL